ncbi:MAG TPA: thioesterase [Synergistales bacterium]|nr:thioesterase [Synergistales bacterium]HQQ10402.1 thioesterase [Synergistales bacterium]
MEYRIDFRVGHSEVGAHGRMRVVNAVNRFQDIAGEHADSLGLGVRDLLSKGYTWVLYRMRLTFSWVAVAGEDLTIRTWYRPERNLYSLRNFSMEDAGGERIIFGESSWVVLDLKKGRPVRLSAAMPASYEENRSGDFSTGFREIPELDEPDTEIQFNVRLHDLDINRHVNNARYLEWALEAIPMEVLGASRPAVVEALFRTPARYGDVIVSQVKRIEDPPGVYLHRLKMGKSRDVCALVRTEWLQGEGYNKACSRKE